MMVAWVVCMFTWAGNNVSLTKIKKQNEGYQTWSAVFAEQQKLASGKVIDLKGVIRFARPTKMWMDYSVPDTDLLIINGADFYMARGGRTSLFNTEKNKRMRQLSATLLYCMMGDVEELATMVDAEVNVTENDTLFTVVLAARRKQVRGYSRIILSYDKRSSLLCRMQMDEFGGGSSVYVLSEHKTNEVFSPEVFDIPK